MTVSLFLSQTFTGDSDVPAELTHASLAGQGDQRATGRSVQAQVHVCRCTQAPPAEVLTLVCVCVYCECVCDSSCYMELT